MYCNNVHPFCAALCLAVITLAAGCSEDQPAAQTNAESAPARESIWTEDFEAAKAQAESQNLPILIKFTGSDWCPPCIAMERDVFNTAEFQEYAETHVVMMKADFPRSREIPGAIASQNEQLAERFGVEAFPTMVLLSSDGQELAREVGYVNGGPAAMQNWVERHRTSQ